MTERASSYVDSVTRETHNWPRSADRRCWWPTMLETGLQCRTRAGIREPCCDASLQLIHLTWTHSQNRIRSATSSQSRTWHRKWMNELILYWAHETIEQYDDWCTALDRWAVQFGTGADFFSRRKLLFCSSTGRGFAVFCVSYPTYLFKTQIVHA